MELFLLDERERSSSDCSGCLFPLPRCRNESVNKNIFECPIPQTFFINLFLLTSQPFRATLTAVEHPFNVSANLPNVLEKRRSYRIIWTSSMLNTQKKLHDNSIYCPSIPSTPLVFLTAAADSAWLSPYMCIDSVIGNVVQQCNNCPAIPLQRPIRQCCTAANCNNANSYYTNISIHQNLTGEFTVTL